MNLLQRLTKKLSLANRFRETKLVLFLIDKPFSSIKHILSQNSIGISNNWDDVNKSLCRLVKGKVIHRVMCDGIAKYFVYDHLDYLTQRPNAHFLMMRDKVMSIIESSTEISNCCQEFKNHYSISDLRRIPKSKFQKKPLLKYHYRVDDDLVLREQILYKFLNLFYIKEKTRIYEMKKISYIDEFYAKKNFAYNQKSFEFFSTMKQFLQNYDKSSNTWSFSFPEIKYFVKHLDFEYESDLTYYKNLRRNGRTWAQRVWVAQRCMITTKTQVSKDLKIRMKSVTKIIAPLKDRYERWNRTKIHYLLRKENGDDILSSESFDELKLVYGNEARTLLNENVREKEKYEKIKDTYESFFGEEIIEN